MLELIHNFLRYTGIHPETFGRLTINDPHLVYKLQDNWPIEMEVQERILNFMHDYEDAKD